jgi:hypothetical protein
MPRNLSSRTNGFPRLTKDHLPIVISVVALIVSGSSLYLTQLRDARIQVHTAPLLYASNKGMNWELRLNVTFTNSGASTGVVRNVVLEVKPANGPSQILQLAYFGGRLTESGDASNDRVPDAIAVEGRSSQAAQMVFISPRRNPDIRVFPQEGTYDLSLLVWDSTREQPTLVEPFRVQVTKHHLDVFGQQPSPCTAEQRDNLDEKCFFVELVNDNWRDWIAGPRLHESRK